MNRSSSSKAWQTSSANTFNLTESPSGIHILTEHNRAAISRTYYNVNGSSLILLHKLICLVYKFSILADSYEFIFKSRHRQIRNSFWNLVADRMA